MSPLLRFLAKDTLPCSMGAVQENEVCGEVVCEVAAKLKQEQMGPKLRRSSEHLDLSPQVGLSPQKGAQRGRMRVGPNRVGIPHFPLQVVHMSQPVRNRALVRGETGD